MLARIKGLKCRPGGPDYLVQRSTSPAKAYTYEFTVVGKGAFPVDMLRYDQCFPKDGDSGANITLCEGQQRTVDLRAISYQPNYTPTFDRWRSFGWMVATDIVI